jgi:hypothetical protein
MRFVCILLLTFLCAIAGCSAASNQERLLAKSEPAAETTKQSLASSASTSEGMLAISLGDADRGDPTRDRKIIRNADLTIEVPSTIETQQLVSAIAESRGGFVVNSESKQRENVDPTKRTVDIKLILRVPANQFGSAVEEIKKLASNLPQVNVTGDDVSEEFIDLEARIKTQKALEAQFLEIMKDARKVQDALEVQRQLAEVRNDIEKTEGRKRFLENRAALSTITVNIQSPTPITVSTTGFRHTVREAAAESLDIASGMVLFFVRFVIVMIPIALFVFLPLGLIILYLTRRAKRMRLAATLATQTSS